MKKIKLSFLVFMIALVLSSCQGGKDEIVATVGEEKITSQELLFVMVDALKDADEKTDLDKVKEQSLKYLIGHSLFFLDAQDNGINVSDNEVKAMLNSVYSGDELNSLKKNYGISVDSVKKVIKKQIFHQKYVINVLENKEDYIPKEEQLMDFFYNNYYKAQHILISKSLEDAKIKTENLYDEIDEETDFNELTLLNSEDSGIICGPGEYLIFKEGEAEDWFYEVVSSLSENEVSMPVESIYGYHIIKRFPLLNSDFADKEAILINEYKTNYTSELVEELKEKYKVVKNDKKLKEITVSTGF